MTDLRDRMHDTVSHHHADLPALAAQARRQGTSLRRRRRRAMAGSAVAVVAVAATAAVAGAGLLADHQTGSRLPVAGDGSGAPPVPTRVHRADATVQATGRTTVAALYAAVTDLVPGKGTDFVGQGPEESGPIGSDTYGEMAFAPADGSGAGRVGVNVQSAHILDDPQRGITARQGFVCVDWMESCQVSTLPDGSMLRTYAEHSAAAGGGTGERLVAEHLIGQLRVVASASNGFEGPSNEWDLTRPDAVLTTDQLTTVVPADSRCGRSLGTTVVQLVGREHRIRPGEVPLVAWALEAVAGRGDHPQLADEVLGHEPLARAATRGRPSAPRRCAACRAVRQRRRLWQLRIQSTQTKPWRAVIPRWGSSIMSARLNVEPDPSGAGARRPERTPSRRRCPNRSGFFPRGPGPRSPCPCRGPGVRGPQPCGAPGPVPREGSWWTADGTGGTPFFARDCTVHCGSGGPPAARLPATAAVAATATTAEHEPAMAGRATPAQRRSLSTGLRGEGKKIGVVVADGSLMGRSSFL